MFATRFLQRASRKSSFPALIKRRQLYGVTSLTIRAKLPLKPPKPPLSTWHPLLSRSNSFIHPAPGATSFPDTERPDLFYHLLGPPSPASDTFPVFALSFLPTVPPRPDSKTIIGWLPAESTENGSVIGESGLNDFVENPLFMDTLQNAVASGLRNEVDEYEIHRAVARGEGWMHIHDQRNPPVFERIGDPEDILASILVRDGKMMTETYQPMPAYRLVTADGVTELTPGLSQHLVTTLMGLAESERAELLKHNL